MVLFTQPPGYAIGDVVTQGEDLVYSVSRTLTSPEPRYSTIERELLAVCYGVRKLPRF
jgi:hypothetical protein